MSKPPVELTSYDGMPAARVHMDSKLDDDVIRSMGQLLSKRIDSLEEKFLIVDFTDVPFITSQVLVMLVELHNKLAAEGGRMVLMGIKPDLMKVFTLTRLDHLLNFADSPVQAGRIFASLRSADSNQPEE